MQSNKLYPPFIRVSDSTSRVMYDVILALLPCTVMAYFAFGFVPWMLILTAVGSALLTEFVFSMIFGKKSDSLADGSAIVTGILLAFTVGSFTPLYVVAFGGASGVLFGKLLWGGLGRNVFNPALIGREFMTVFFPSVMTSGSIWYNAASSNLKSIPVFDADWLDVLFFKPSGAVGEFSVFFLIVGGLYLLLRHRITWHIPFALFLAFTLLLFLFRGNGLSFSLGGVMLGAIFMATDMPSSASTNTGKLYYGAMIGVTAVLFIISDIKYEYMSYSILLMNAFVQPVNWVFRPRTWANKWNFTNRLGLGILLTGIIILVVFAIVYLHNIEGVKYLLFGYIVYCIIRFNESYIKGQFRFAENRHIL